MNKLFIRLPLPSSLKSFLQTLGKSKLAALAILSLLLVLIAGASFYLLNLKFPTLSIRPSASPLASPSPSQSSPAPSPDPELLEELLTVVWFPETAEPTDFPSLWNAFSQGASLEGIHNGLTHSARYAKLEANNRGSSATALRIFGEELEILEQALTHPRTFTSHSLEQQKADFQSLEAQDEEPEVKSISVSSGNYSQIFIGASIYTLKRVLTEEVIRAVSEHSSYPLELSEWYSQWISKFLTRHSLDSTSQRRQEASETLHFQWASRQSKDRLTWEILYFVHTLMNESDRNQP